jgi:hypothetical protein
MGDARCEVDSGSFPVSRFPFPAPLAPGSPPAMASAVAFAENRSLSSDSAFA